jgi:hypothetical protein
MNRLPGFTVVVGLYAALVASSAWADSNAFVGRWRLNRAQSTLPPGEPVPKDLICDIARAESNHVAGIIAIGIMAAGATVSRTAGSASTAASAGMAAEATAKSLSRSPLSAFGERI